MSVTSMTRTYTTDRDLEGPGRRVEGREEGRRPRGGLGGFNSIRNSSRRVDDPGQVWRTEDRVELGDTQTTVRNCTPVCLVTSAASIRLRSTAHATVMQHITTVP